MVPILKFIYKCKVRENENVKCDQFARFFSVVHLRCNHTLIFVLCSFVQFKNKWKIKRNNCAREFWYTFFPFIHNNNILIIITRRCSLVFWLRLSIRTFDVNKYLSILLLVQFCVSFKFVSDRERKKENLCLQIIW